MIYQAQYRGQDGARPRVVRFRLAGCCPSGLDVKVDADIAGVVRPLSASRMIDLTNLETGEIVDDPVEYFIDRFLAAERHPDGSVRLGAWIEALPTTGVGPTKARAMAVYVGDWAVLSDWMAGAIRGEPGAVAALAEMIRASPVGPSVIESLESLWRDPSRWARVEARASRWPIGPPIFAVGALSGERVCFSGALPSLSRRMAQKIARDAGAEIATTVAAGVTLLVAGPGAGEKLEKARSCGVAIVSEEDFLARVGWADRGS